MEPIEEAFDSPQGQSLFEKNETNFKLLEPSLFGSQNMFEEENVDHLSISSRSKVDFDRAFDFMNYNMSYKDLEIESFSLGRQNSLGNLLF